MIHWFAGQGPPEDGLSISPIGQWRHDKPILWGTRAKSSKAQGFQWPNGLFFHEGVDEKKPEEDQWLKGTPLASHCC